MTDSQPFLPFALPDIGEAEIAEVVDTLRSGWVTTGPKTKRFESEFASFLGTSGEAIAVNSATAGMHLALEALGIGPGDEVIVPVFTFTASGEVVRYLGADPVFVDLDPNTLNLDPVAVAAAISPRTKAILPVHIAGLACDMDALYGLAEAHGLAVVEDAAHALPSTYGGALVGNLRSAATVYSFYATKTLTTGEGGMVVTPDPALANRCRVMRLHGISRDVFDRYSSTLPKWYYEVVAPGFKYNMSDIAAGLGLQQLKRVFDLHQQRRSIAMRYQQAFAGLPVDRPPHAPQGETHAWHLYILRLKKHTPLDRNRFIECMAERGIGCSVHFIPLHHQPYWRDRYELTPEQFPHAEAAFNAAVSLPIYTRMTDADVARVITAVTELLAC